MPKRHRRNQHIHVVQPQLNLPAKPQHLQQQGGKTCPSCNAAISDTAKFCPKCGASLTPPPVHEAPTLCVYCGTPFEKDAKFCLECGEAVPLPPDEEHMSLFSEAQEMHLKRMSEERKESDCNIHKWHTLTYEGEEDIFGFDERETETIIQDRARRIVLKEMRESSDYYGIKSIWAGMVYENDYDSTLESAWSWEKHQFRTDNPQLHEKLFKTWGKTYILLEAQKREIVTPLWTLSKQGIQDLKVCMMVPRNWTGE